MPQEYPTDRSRDAYAYSRRAHEVLEDRITSPAFSPLTLALMSSAVAGGSQLLGWMRSSAMLRFMGDAERVIQKSPFLKRVAPPIYEGKEVFMRRGGYTKGIDEFGVLMGASPVKKKKIRYPYWRMVLRNYKSLVFRLSKSRLMLTLLRE